MLTRHDPTSVQSVQPQITYCPIGCLVCAFSHNISKEMSGNQCRLCLGSKNLIWAFDKRLEYDICQMIEASTGIQIRKTDFISQMVCSRCCRVATFTFEFKLTSNRNDRALKARHARHNVSQIVKVPEKTKRKADAPGEVRKTKSAKLVTNDLGNRKMIQATAPLSTIQKPYTKTSQSDSKTDEMHTMLGNRLSNALFILHKQEENKTQGTVTKETHLMCTKTPSSDDVTKVEQMNCSSLQLDLTSTNTDNSLQVNTQNGTSFGLVSQTATGGRYGSPVLDVRQNMYEANTGNVFLVPRVPNNNAAATRVVSPLVGVNYVRQESAMITQYGYQNWGA